MVTLIVCGLSCTAVSEVTFMCTAGELSAKKQATWTQLLILFLGFIWGL